MKTESAMEEVKAFNAELQSLYESRPPVSKAKMTDITKRAMKGVKLYKHVVHAVEKFIHKCKAEYKVPGLYVIDSIVRQSRHQFTADKDVFAPRFQKNIRNTFNSLVKCPDEQKPKIVRVLNLWQKNAVFPTEVTQMLHEVVASSMNKGETVRNGTPTEAMTVEDSSLATKMTTFANQFKEQNSKEGKPSFDRKLLDFDYGEEEDEKVPEPVQIPEPKVEDVQRIANTVLNPSILESLQKALAAQGVSQILKLDGAQPEIPMPIAPNHLMGAPFGISMMVTNPFAAPQEPEVFFPDSGKDEDFRNRDVDTRRRSRSPRRRSRSPNRSRRRSRDRKRSSSAERERDRQSKGLPPIKRGYITLCSNTLWLGHISKATTAPDLEASFGEFGKIISIDVIAPRGCAYICMDRRQDAYRTLVSRRHMRLRGSSSRIKIAWAPHKGAKNFKDFKDYWDVDLGAFYIPEDRLPISVDFAQLEEGGMLDAETLPEQLRQRFEMVKNGDKPPFDIPTSMAHALPAGIPMPFGVPPFPMPPLTGAGGNPALPMLGLTGLGIPPMMLPGMMRPPSQNVNLQAPNPVAALAGATVTPNPPISQGTNVNQPSPTPLIPSNGDLRMRMSNFGPRMNTGSIPNGPLPGMPLGGMMPQHRPMMPRGHMPPRMPPRGPPQLGMPPRNGLDGRMDGMDLPPRFGGPVDFLQRGPPMWNGPPGPGPNWGVGPRGPPPGMRPDFTNPPPNFRQQQPQMGGNFMNVPLPMNIPRAGAPTLNNVPEKRPNDNVPNDRPERKRRSRWSDAPEDTTIPPPTLIDTLPKAPNPPPLTVVSERNEEQGTPVADETASPKAPGDDGFDMFIESPRKDS